MPALASPSARYRLASHVRGCHVDGQVILLDLRRSKYLGVAGPHVAALSQVVSDWPASIDGSMNYGAVAAAKGWIAALLSQGMLTPATGAGARNRQRDNRQIDEPLESLNAEMTQPACEWRQLAGLCWAAVLASFWLKQHSLEGIAARVAALRHGASKLAGPTQSEDLHGAVASFVRLRPLVFTAHDKCLLDSLCLIRFLAMQGMPAAWVIGVRTRPFGAHSWVQSASLVLNDVHENVRAYTPILVV